MNWSIPLWLFLMVYGVSVIVVLFILMVKNWRIEYLEYTNGTLTKDLRKSRAYAKELMLPSKAQILWADQRRRDAEEKLIIEENV